MEQNRGPFQYVCGQSNRSLLTHQIFYLKARALTFYTKVALIL